MNPDSHWVMIVTGGLGEIYVNGQPMAGSLTPDTKLLQRLVDMHNLGRRIAYLEGINEGVGRAKE